MKDEERNTVRVVVFDKEQYDGDWPPGDLVGTIQWFKDKLNEIPGEFRSGAKCDIHSSLGYEDCHYGRIEITYQRPETGEETAGRMAGYKREAEIQRSRELATLAALEAKYRKQN